MIDKSFNQKTFVKFLPYEEIRIETCLPPKEIEQRLLTVTEPSGIFSDPFSLSHKPFRGKIANDSFEIRRVVFYRTCLPTLVGRIQNSSVQITLRLNYIAAVFVILWFSVCGAFSILCLFIILINFMKGNAFNLYLLIAPGMFVGGYLMTILPFKYEAWRAKSIIRELLVEMGSV